MEIPLLLVSEVFFSLRGSRSIVTMREKLISSASYHILPTRSHTANRYQNNHLSISPTYHKLLPCALQILAYVQSSSHFIQPNMRTVFSSPHERESNQAPIIHTIQPGRCSWRVDSTRMLPKETERRSQSKEERKEIDPNAPKDDDDDESRSSRDTRREYWIGK